MGESMGAVTALLTMEKANSQSVPLEEKPLFCVADCPFSDWDSMMRLQGKKRYGFDPSPLLPLVKRFIRQKSGAQMDTVNAVKAQQYKTLIKVFYEDGLRSFVEG